MKKTALFALVCLVVAGLLAAGCGNPCQDLGNKVCDCQPTRAKVDQCKISLSTAADNIDLSDDEESRCQEILDSGSCTCEALLADDLAACGLAESALIVWE